MKHFMKRSEVSKKIEKAANFFPKIRTYIMNDREMIQTIFG